jgi:hypothetical protein
MKKVAVIGAGISGLVMANAMQQRGYEVTVFEKGSTIGESWERGTYFIGEVPQSVKKDYTFYGTDLPPLSSEWPDGEEMQEYLESYALKTAVHPLISFQTTVQKIHFDKTGWKISARKQHENREQQFDAVIVCTGFEPDSYSYTEDGSAIRFRENAVNTMLCDRKYWPLYRNIAIAGCQSIGFIGMNGSLYFTLTAIIAAHWMAACLSGAIPLPAQLPAEGQTKRFNKRRQISQLIHYLNLLLKDMGGKPLASSHFLFRMLGASFEPAQYAALAGRLTGSHASSFFGPFSRSCFS